MGHSWSDFAGSSPNTASSGGADGIDETLDLSLNSNVLTEIYKYTMEGKSDEVNDLLKKCPYVDLNQVAYVHTFSLHPLPFSGRVGRTPVFVLHAAAALKRRDIMHLLLQHGADPNVTDIAGQTALHLSTMPCPGSQYCLLPASNESKDLVSLLCSNGANVHSKDIMLRSAVHKTAMYGLLSCMLFLINEGSDADARDCDDVTPLMLAAESGQLKTMRALLKRGANVRARTKSNQTVLHHAAMLSTGLRRYRSKLSAVSILMEHDVDVNAQDDAGQTPLHIAAKRRDYSVIRYLIKYGADLGIRTRQGRTPFYEFLDGLNLKLTSNAVDVHMALILFLQDTARPGPFTDSEGVTPSCFAEDAIVSEFQQKVIDILLESEKSTFSLQFLCRLTIRRALTQHRMDRVNDLPLPTSLREYINSTTASWVTGDLLELFSEEVRQQLRL
ncbi:ankyrin repeat domain-containing protein 61-like [Saccoglossus kowalevskii]|uniref:Ankyrin repeat domain-containing protein 61-like n=1 Tax=Saccoglossus kowalevskii TaxID=10224 RepID=A0ABM0MJN3_SACKO|nr:PREDICTED: ankyrin repeat domain-containing protein 61-like [Saccoglossus kowalevskii]